VFLSLTQDLSAVVGWMVCSDGMVQPGEAAL
jgi:hypothetical protein